MWAASVEFTPLGSRACTGGARSAGANRSLRKGMIRLISSPMERHNKPANTGGESFTEVSATATPGPGPRGEPPRP